MEEHLTKDERDALTKTLKYRWDNKNVMDYAIEKAEERGFAIGLKLSKANNKERRETAREMLADGEALEKIAKYTKLSIQEIEEL